jgi:hypothetical protein
MAPEEALSGVDSTETITKMQLVENRLIWDLDQPLYRRDLDSLQA